MAQHRGIDPTVQATTDSTHTLPISCPVPLSPCSLSPPQKSSPPAVVLPPAGPASDPLCTEAWHWDGTSSKLLSPAVEVPYSPLVTLVPAVRAYCHWDWVLNTFFVSLFPGHSKCVEWFMWGFPASMCACLLVSHLSVYTPAHSLEWILVYCFSTKSLTKQLTQQKKWKGSSLF